MLEKIKNILKNWFNAESMDIVCPVILFVLTLGSILLVIQGYYLDAICGFLAIIAVSSISAYIDRKRIHTYLKTLLEKNGNR